MPKVPVNRRKNTSLFTGILLIALLISSCNQPEVIHDLSNSSYQLVDEDSLSVNYPSDYLGEFQVVTFIFTNCPDVCPAITANLKNIRDNLEDPTDIQFLEFTFDPERDSPSALKRYKNTFRMDEEYTLLTGDTATVNSLLDEFGIIAKKVRADTIREDSDRYNMKHSNRILVLDKHARVRFEYPGSYVKPEHVIEDIEKLR